MVGKNAAAFVPGASAPVGFHANPVRAALGVASLAPQIRGGGAVVRGVHALRAGGDVAAAIGTARSTMKGYGPLANLKGRVGGWLAENPANRAALRVLGMRTRPPLGPRPAGGYLAKGLNRGLINTDALRTAKRRAQAAAARAERQRRLRTAAAGIAQQQP